MVCQNQDLTILTLMVEDSILRKINVQDVEQTSLNEFSNWQEWLQDSNNILLKDVMRQDTEFADYLKKVYKELTNSDYSPSNDTDNLESKSDDMADAKALHELQVLDGSLDLNMKFNISLDLTKNFALMVHNNRNIKDDQLLRCRYLNFAASKGGFYL